MGPDQFAQLVGGDFDIAYQRSMPEIGWSGSEPDYAPWTITVVTYEDDAHSKVLGEDDWLRYAEFELESGLDHVAADLKLRTALHG